MAEKEKESRNDEQVTLEDLEPKEEATEDVRGGQGFALLGKGN